ncbi:MAG: class I SAM-dependent methyltransferase [Thermomicrobiales bacterium]
MQSFAHRDHRHQVAGEAFMSETHGNVMNWGRPYDVVTRVVFPLMLGHREQTFRRKIADMARLQPGERVLDVGCGTGTLALVARERVGETGRVCGIDPAPKQIAYARHKAAQRGLPIDFQIGVIEEIAYPDRSFDVVLSTMMMHHLTEDLKRRGLAEIARVLKPGGRLLILDMRGAGRWKSHMADQPALMKEAGFAAVETGKSPFRGLDFALGRMSKTGEEGTARL